MGKLKVFIYLTLFLITNNGFSQVDTVDFRFIRDVATFRIRCQAEKIISGDTTSFEISDTLNGAYSFDWGGDKEPVIDGLPFVTYEFDNAGVYTFTLSVYEDVSSKTYTVTKTFPLPDIIEVPNVFTPNGDGINDLFIVRANGIDPLEISIFNKIGVMVFNVTSPIIVWDGKNSSGSELSGGVYYYILKSKKPNGFEKNGFIHMYTKQP